MIELVIVAAFVTANNVFWAWAVWHMNTRLQTQCGKLLEGVLVLAPSKPEAEATQAASLASQMEATDRAQVDGDQIAKQRAALRAAT